MPPAHELRFHLNRLGSRANVEALYGLRHGRVRAALPMEDVDLLHAGELVLIGRILAKRCASCGVAREIEHFTERQDTRSGCGGVCRHCREQ